MVPRRKRITEREKVEQMNTAKVPFQTHEMGYNKGQVDKYIQKLSEEYGNLQQKFIELSEKASRSDVYSDDTVKAIAKAMVDAEIKGIQIVSEAKSEAARIIENAYMELEQIKGAKERTILEINDLLKGLKEVVPAQALSTINNEMTPEFDLYNVKEMVPRREKILANL